MGSAEAPPPPPPLPLLLLLVALGICSLLGTGHALPQGASAAGSPTLGASCSSAADCTSITQAECQNGTCRCPATHPIPNTNECLQESGLKQDCTITAQCKPQLNKIVCSSDKKCGCVATHKLHEYDDGTLVCLPTREHTEEKKKTPVDPAMIGILVALVLMFIIICIVLQLFSKARFRQNRTILNSANPRLMNTSFLKGASGKPGSAAGGRGHHGSRGSLSTGPDSGHDKMDGGASQLAERPVGSGSGSDPVSEARGPPVLPPLTLSPLPPLRHLSTAAPDARSLDAPLRLGSA